MSSSSRGRLEGRLTQVGQAGRCTTADRSLPGSWDAERQVHKCTCVPHRCTGRQEHRSAASIHRSVVAHYLVIVQDSWEADTPVHT